MRFIPQFFLLIILAVFFSPNGFSETSDHGDNANLGQSSSSNTTNGQRPKKSVPLTDRELTFLSDNFFLSQLTLWNKYSEKLPQAIEKAMKDQDEKDSSQIIAQLMGMVNKNQAERVLENAKKEKETEAAKKPNSGDDRYIALMERLVWGAKLFLNTPSKEESAEKYNEEFKTAFKDVEAKNAEILEKIKQASEGNEQAKDWLRKNLDQSSLLSFVEGQKKYGNGQLADRMLDALSFKDGKNKFVDMSLQNETQRLHLGQTPQSVSTAFDKFIENKKGFNGAVVSFSPFSSAPMKQWHVDDKGSFKNGAPSPTNRVAQITNTSGSQLSSSSTVPNRLNGPSGVSANSTSVNSSGAYAKILSTCNKCHAGDITIDSNGTLLKDGSPRSKAEILSAFNEVRQMAQPTAKLTAEERSSVMALVSKWLK